MSSSITDLIHSATSTTATSSTSAPASGFSSGPRVDPDRPNAIGTMGIGQNNTGKGTGLPLYGQIIVFTLLGFMALGGLYAWWWYHRKSKRAVGKRKADMARMGAVEVGGDKGDVEIIELPKLGREDERV